MAMRLAFAALGLSLVASGAAWATPKDYCEAYARDFADRGPKDEKLWNVHRDNAMADCLLQFQPANAAPEEQAPPPPKIVKKVAKAPAPQKVKRKVAPAPEQDMAEPLPDPAVIVAPDIEPPPSSKGAKQPAQVARSKTLLAKLFSKKDPDVPDAAPVGKAGKPAPGTSAWLDYCDRKYASFNRETGTYKSYKGIERKCLVTD